MLTAPTLEPSCIGLGAAKDAKDRNVPQWKGTIIEIQVDDHIDFHWSHKNLDEARRNGARAAANAYKLYEAYHKKKQTKDGVLIIPDDLSDVEILKAGVRKEELPLKRKREPDGTLP